MADKPYIEKLAETTNNIIVGGLIDPSAKEIAEAHFPEHDVLGGEIEGGIAKRLPRIRDVLRDDYALDAYLVNRSYYHRFKRVMPDTITEARLCMPLGQSVTAAGIRIISGDDDLIWRATIEQNSHSGGGKLKKAIDRIGRAYEHKQISGPRAAELITDAGQRAAPENPQLIAEALEQLGLEPPPELPPGEEE